MPIIYGTVGAPSSTSAPDASNQPVLQGKSGEFNDANLHAKYYTQSYRSRAFIGSTAGGGVVPPNYSSSAQTFGLWNQGTGSVNAVLESLDMNVVTLGTPAVSSLCLAWLQNAGTGIATGGISAFTAGSPVKANLSGTGGNNVLFTPSSATVPTTSLILQNLPWSYFSTTTTTLATFANTTLHYDFDGGILVSPNTALFVAANILTGSTWGITLKWYEAAI